MDKHSLRLVIQAKITEGRLPRERLPRMLTARGNGETCDGCGIPVTTAQRLMEGWDNDRPGVRLHIACFHVWEVERRLPADTPPTRYALGSASGVRFPRSA